MRRSDDDRDGHADELRTLRRRVAARIEGPEPAGFIKKPYSPWELIDLLRGILAE